MPCRLVIASSICKILTEIIALAKGAKGEDAFGYRADFIGLARLAQPLPEA